MSYLLSFDFDDVLANFNDAIRKWHNKTYGTSYRFEDVQHLDFRRVWHCTEKEVVERIFEFYDSPDHPHMEPIAGGYEVLQKLAKEHTCIIVTSRPSRMREITTKWLRSHYPNVFDDANLYFLDLIKEQHLTKGTFLKEIGARLLVEDHHGHAVSASKEDIPTLLLDKGWNQDPIPEELSNLKRVKNWKEIGNAIQALL